MSESSSLTDRVVARLDEAELQECDPWVRDAIRIARITVIYAAKGEPHANFWATYAVLRTSPDQVWPLIVRQRRSKFGELYSHYFDENDVWRGGDFAADAAPPKKLAQSVVVDKIRQRAKAAAA